MNENEMSQQERDAAWVAEMRESCRVIENADRTYSYDENYYIARDYFYANRNHLPFAALRTIDAQAAEIDRLTAERDRLRALLDGVPEMLSSYALRLSRDGDDVASELADAVVDQVKSIRAALAAPARDDADGGAG
jgi:hypothetical protein